MSRRTTTFILVIFLLSSLFIPSNTVKAVTVLPAGFVSEAVVTNLTGPTTIAFAPDGRMFIGQKDGRIRVFQNGVLLPASFINLSAQVNNYWDRGLLGIAIHPNFPSTPYIYFLYTYDPVGVTADGGGARVSRLLRVTADPNNTNVALPGSEVVLLGTNSTFANIGNPNNNDGAPSCESGGVYVQDCIAADSPSHTIGTLAFGTDGSLFVSSGDGAHFNYTDVRALRSLSVDSLNGKILRIDPITGEGYPDNPFYNGDPASNRSKVYSLGLRNPFRITVNTLTSELFIGDVGWNTWEEMNTGRGKNFGWPCYEGNNAGSAQQTSYKNLAATSATCAALYAQGIGAVQAPLYAYNHSSGSSSIQAGGFYQGIVYPSQYQGALFFSDYNGDWIRYLTFDSNGVATKFDFGTDIASGTNSGVVQLLIGPDTNLYYVAYDGPTPNTSQIRRIRYTAGGNTPPTANASADPDSGNVPLVVNFSSNGSFDPDAQTLTYTWNFGDGNNGTGPNPSHTYVTNGNYTATLTITDPAGGTGSDTVDITVGNLQPVATIIAPTDGFGYNTGDIINYNGTGVDNEDGNLSGASLQWDILLHHDQHVHFDYLPGLIGNTGSFPVPDHGDNTWIELCLNVTDSGDLRDQECVNLQPNIVTLSFDTVPSGLELEYDGITYITPFSVSTNVNSVRDLIAPLTQEGCHNFTSWSDSGAASHQITISSVPQTYIATYTPCPLTVTVNSNQSKTYGTNNPIYAYTSSNPAATFTGVLNRTLGENAGTYPINQGTLAVIGNKYTIASFIPANFVINKKTASVTVNAASKIYGSAEPVLTGTLNGFLPADNVTATYSRIAGETIAGNPYTISAVLAPVGVLGNYNITYNTANFSINPKSASVTPNAVSKTFGSADPPLTGNINGFLPADNVTATYSRTTGETVAGSPYTIAAALAPLGVLGNYTITYNTANFMITQASSTVSLSNLNYVYDRTQKSATAITNPPGLPVSITYNGSATPPTNAGTYTVVATINHPNYSGTASDTLVINRAVVDPSVTAADKIYNGTTVAAIGARNLAGVFFGDAVNLSGGMASFANKNIGTNKTVTAVGLTLSGTNAGNYQLSTTSATTTANITSRTLTITATGVNKGYDGTTAATVTLSDDRVGGDILTTNYANASFLDPNVGSGKTVSVSGLSLSGGDSGNYTLGNITAATTADITIASQTITITTPAPAYASEGSTFTVAPKASSGLPVAITTSGVCTPSGNNNITMNSGSGVCSIFYNQAGNNNYGPAIQVQEDVNATQKPSIASADNTTFSLGFSGTFTVTTTGNPSTPMAITIGGTIPAGVTFIDNNDGTATLSGIPTVSGVFPITFTANNGVPPNASQTFILTIKNGPVIGARGISWISETSNGSIRENEVVLDTTNMNKITVEFSQDVLNVPSTDLNFGDSVINPANYILVMGSATGVFQTVSCNAGLVAPDIAISVDSVSYKNNNGSGPYVATLNINGGDPLNVVGFYRLYVCGTTSIVDALNPSLILAGNGTTPGTDFLRNFRISTRVTAGVINNTNNNSNSGQAFATSNLLIPVTGFAPDRITSLPAQPADTVYKSLGEVRIEIPTLSINYPIVGATINKNGWNLTWLKDSVAYLEGSAYPTLAGNTVLTAHVMDANNNPGPFSDIKGMQSGQKIYIHANGQIYIYQVDENRKIAPSNISAAFEHEEYSWITLVTCEDYNAKTGLYTNRRMVRAVLVSVILEK